MLAKDTKIAENDQRPYGNGFQQAGISGRVQDG
jgi:hypothetical protein